MGLVKKIKTVVRWVFGILLLLLGALIAIAGAAAGVLWILSGLLILPPVTKKIPPFKGRRPALIFACIALVIVGIVAIPEPEPTAQAEATPSGIPQDVSPEPSQKPAPESLKIDTEALRAWVNASISSAGDVTAKERDLKKWRSVAEKDFLPVWKSVVLEHLAPIEQRMSEEDWDMGIFDSLIKYLGGAKELYQSLYGSSGTISEVERLTDRLSEYVAANQGLQEKYPFDLRTVSPSYGTFYITQRLENAYSDNILGALQKEFDSYEAQEESKWVAYDVDYVLDTPIPGDTFRILHADSLNPFTQSGVYTVCYLDAGETTETVNQQGFRNTVPVYQLIDSSEELELDQQLYHQNQSQCCIEIERLKYILGAEEYTELQADKEDLSDVISGVYYQNGDTTSGSGICIELDYFSGDPAGYFYYLADGEQFDGGDLVKIAPNIYFSCVVEVETYLFGFSKRDGEIVMDAYYNGVHQSSGIKR